MHIPRLLLIPLVISVCTALIEAQSSSDTNPSQLLSTLPEGNAQANIGIDHLQLPFRWDKKDLSHTMAGTTGASGHASFIIPPLELHAIPPLEFRVLDLPLFGQSGICFYIRGYRVTRDDPESDSTRPAGYSTCQPATRFHVKGAGYLRETEIR